MTDQDHKRRSLGQRIRRFLSSPEQLEAENRADLAKEAGAIPLNECHIRQKVTVRGIVASVTTSSTSWLEADLNDGTGTVSLIWMGRRRIECIVPGRHLLATGRLTEEDGRRVIFNPEFEVLS